MFLVVEKLPGYYDFTVIQRITHTMIQEIISMPRVDPGYPHNFMVNSRVFKDDESETDAKIKSGHRVCPLLARAVHAQSLLLAH